MLTINGAIGARVDNRTEAFGAIQRNLKVP